MIDTTRLDQELRAVLTINAFSVGWPYAQNEPNCSYHDKDGVVVRVCWLAPPSASQIAQAAAIITAHDGTPTPDQRLDRMSLSVKVLGAVALRLSESWTTPPPVGATAVEKARAMAIINAAGQKALDTIRS